MGTTTRHFNALMRKNFINWKREPCSAVCQLICPGMLMLILVYVRSRIDPTYFNASTLALLEIPQYQIDMGSDGLLDLDSTQERMANFTKYYYYNLPTLTLDVETDPSSPLQLNPENCLLNSSFVLPKVAAPYIAIVGDLTTNGVMNRINNYMVQLQKYWATNSINNLTLVYYDTVADLDSYISSDSYLYPDEGICFGISVEPSTTSDTYNANLIFDD